MDEAECTDDEDMKDLVERADMALTELVVDSFLLSEVLMLIGFELGGVLKAAPGVMVTNEG